MTHDLVEAVLAANDFPVHVADQMTALCREYTTQMGVDLADPAQHRAWFAGLLQVVMAVGCVLDDADIPLAEFPTHVHVAGHLRLYAAARLAPGPVVVETT